MAEENQPASKKDFKSVIDSLASAQAVAEKKRAKEDQIKSGETSERLEKIANELKTANATKTLKLEEEKSKLQQELNSAVTLKTSGKRAIEIQKAALELQKNAIEAAGGVATDNKEYRIGQLNIRKEEISLRKQGAQGKAAKEEIAKDERKLRDDRFNEYLGPGSFLAKGFSGLKNTLSNLTGPAKGILSTLGTVAALAALAAFLRSDLWKNIKEKLIPILAKGLKAFYEGLKEFAGEFMSFIENPSFSGFISMFTGKSSTFLLALAGITALLNPLKSLKLLGLGVRGLIGGVKLFAKGLGGISRLVRGGSTVGRDAKGRFTKKRPSGIKTLGRGLLRGASGVARGAGGLVRGAGSVARGAGGVIRSAAPLLKVGLRGAATAAKFIPGVGLAVTAAMGIFDGMSAGIEEYKKSGKLGAAVKEGIAGAASGLTFGLISQETISSGMDFIGEKAKAGWESYKSLVSGTVSGILGFAKDPLGTMATLGTTLSTKFTETVTSIKDGATALNTKFADLTGIDIGAGFTATVGLIKSGATALGTKFTELTDITIPTDFASLKTGIVAGASALGTKFTELTGITVPSFDDIKTKVAELGTSISTMKLPTFDDLKTKVAELGTSISTMKLPSMSDIGNSFITMGDKLSASAEKLTGLKLPDFSDVKKLIEDKFSFKFSDLKLPDIPDVGAMVMDMIRRILKPIAALEFKIPILGTYKAADYLPQSFLDFVGQTGSYKTVTPARSSESVGQSEADRFEQRGKMSTTIVQMNGGTTTNNGTTYALNRSSAVTPAMQALLSGI